ncbi:YciI family protein [Brachybacterium sp.]|jgi:hypothetical protein|uniref:YciI family protein n=1 Tax=Brachybacterium sp. TaxID=1891286 RepID=UPI002ED2E89D
MARYTVFLYSPAQRTEADPAVLEAEMAAHDAHGSELVEEGVMVFGSPLADHDATTSIRADSLVDGPFVEIDEVIVGFYVIEVPDLDAAIAVARRNPILQQGGGVEVRPMSAGGDPGTHEASPA